MLMRLGLGLCVTLMAVCTADSNTTLTVTMFSDAQCPCSAQFTSDIRHILDLPEFAFLDFVQYFVPGVGGRGWEGAVMGNVP